MSEESVARDLASPLTNIDGEFQAIFDAVNDGIFISDPETGKFIDINEPGCRMFGYTKPEILALTVNVLSSGIHPYTQERAVELNQKACSGEPQIFEWQCKTKDGALFWTEISLRYTEFDREPVIVAVMRDISKRKELDERFRQLADNIEEVFWMSNPEKTEILYVSPSYETIWGRSCQSLYENPRQWIEAIHDKDRDSILEAAKRQARSEYNEEYRIVRPDGEVRWISDRAFQVCDGTGKVYRVAGVASDITERKRQDAEIERMAHNDALTNLPNRYTFTKTLERAIAQSRRAGQEFAVLSLDLDNFKDVNDTRGHPAGDRLLQIVAERLLAGVRLNDSVARFGGDEFAILLGDPRDADEIAAVASRLIASVSKPYVINGLESLVSASIGVAMSGKDGSDAEALMSNADIALYRAKEEGRQTYRFFSNEMHQEVQERVSLTSELRFAIANGQLFLVYQPQVTAESGRIVGVEALVRWRHPRRGSLAPDQFLPAAKSSGLIGPLGEWVLRHACRQARQWIDDGISLGTMSVNLASAQFNDPLALEELVLDTLTETGLPPRQLELEITESTLISLSSQHAGMIQRLRAVGVRFALDDFGTGNSSLNHLRRFPIDRIKIAREFIAELTTSRKTASIVNLILGLAGELGNDVVAEGVETAEQLRLLQDRNATAIQGFYFATPLSAKIITPLLKAGSIEPSKRETASSAA